MLSLSRSGENPLPSGRLVWMGKIEPGNQEGEKMGLNIRDYFSKFGFEDGDDLRLAAEARSARPRVVELLNKEFKRRGLVYQAREWDGSSHNLVRIQIVWVRGGMVHYWEGPYYGICRERTYFEPSVHVSEKWPREVSQVLDRVKKILLADK